MVYKHKYFSLDTKSKSIFDENNKKLRLTGNSYRVLTFLCDNKLGTVTDIGNFLDWAKDYDENHLRQYRYKINSIIGHDVITYQNGVYSLEGNIEKLDKMEEIESNTDLLQEDNVKSKAETKDSDMAKSKSSKLNKIPAIIACIVLLLSFIDWSSYSYYTFMKIVVTAVAIYYAYYLYEVIKRVDFWFWALVVIAILFNPVIPIYLYDKSIWMVIDIVVIGFLVGLISKFKK